MDNNALIEQLLTEAKANYPNTYSLGEFHRRYFPDRSPRRQTIDLKLIVSPLLLDGLVEHTRTSTEHIKCTEAGMKVATYAEFMDNQIKSGAEQREIERLSKEKLKYDLKNAKRVYDSYWITFFMSLAALLISLSLVIIEMLKSGDSK